LLIGGVGADRRGGQSYGSLLIDGDKYNVQRGLGPLVAADFKEIAKAQAGFLHSRYATSGDVTIENAHPFDKYAPVIGAHNGCVYNAKELDKLYGKKEVDSEHIFERISQGKNLKDFVGYGIVEWYNTERPGEIFLCDIGDGELTVFEIRGPNKRRISGYFWTSELEDGLLALAGAGLTEKDYEVFGLMDNVIYSFKDGYMSSEPGKLKVRSTHQPVVKPSKVSKTKGYTGYKGTENWYKQYKEAVDPDDLWDSYPEEDIKLERALRYY